MSVMLDENAILPAVDLGLTEEEREALIQTRILLAQEKVPHAGGGKPGFTMSTAAEEYSCGAACCIGGHMSLLMQGLQPVNGIFQMTFEESDIAWRFVDDREYDHKISDLFFPYDLLDKQTGCAFDWDRITP